MRPRYLRGLDCGAIRAAASTANVALGTLLSISSQAVAVLMEETLGLGADDWKGSNADSTGAPEQTGPGFTSTSPALRRSNRRCKAGWAAPVLEKRGCAPPMAQAGCVWPDSRICVRKLHLLAGHHVKVPDCCLRMLEPKMQLHIVAIPSPREHDYRKNDFTSNPLCHITTFFALSS